MIQKVFETDLRRPVKKRAEIKNRTEESKLRTKTDNCIAN